MTAPHDDCAALRLKCAALEAALEKWTPRVWHNHDHEVSFSPTHFYETPPVDGCPRCELDRIGSGEPTALREMLVEAADAERSLSDRLAEALEAVRHDRPSAHSDEVWERIGAALAAWRERRER